MDRDYLKNIPDVTKVRATIKLNDVLLDWVSFEINSTNTHAADTFTVEVPLYDQTEEDLAILMDTESLKIEIAVDDGNGTLVRILLGYVDDIEEDIIEGNVTFTGRDMTSWLMDTKALTSKVISEITASQLAADYAQEHVLKQDIVATSQLIGTYDQYHHVKLTGSQSEWDVLCKLAQNENYDLYLTNDTLHFKPKTTSKDYYRIDWDYAAENGFEASNALKLRLHRALTIANDIKVIVKSWNSLNGTSHTYTFNRKHTPQRVKGRSKTQTYVLYANGADPDALEKIAQNALHQLSLHQKKLTTTLIGDSVLSTRSVIKLTGTGHIFDQLYYPDSITRSMSFGEPFLMEVTAKNHDVNTQVV